MEGAKPKLESIQVLNIELWRGPLTQIFLSTLTEVALLRVVCIGPESFDLNTYYLVLSIIPVCIYVNQEKEYLAIHKRWITNTVNGDLWMTWYWNRLKIFGLGFEPSCFAFDIFCK